LTGILTLTKRAEIREAEGGGGGEEEEEEEGSLLVNDRYALYHVHPRVYGLLPWVNIIPCPRLKQSG